MCLICGYVMNPVIVVQSHVHFTNTGSTELSSLTFTKTRDAVDIWVVSLPAEAPVMDGFFFEGWQNTEDGALYAPGLNIAFTYAEMSEVTFTAVWTQLIGIGTYDLSSSTKYRFSSGRFIIAGDDTVYEGDQYFYLSRGGEDTLLGGG